MPANIRGQVSALLAHLLLALAIAVLDFRPVTAADNKAPTEAAVHRLINQLGDDSFAAREAATKRLTALGEPALELLKEAAKNPANLEVGRRAALIVERIERDLFGEVRSIAGHDGWATRIAVTPDGKRVVSSGRDALRVWDVHGGKLLDCGAKGDGYWSLAISADGRRVIAGGNDHVARVYDLETGKLVQELVGHRGPVWGAALSADGRRAITGSWDKSLSVWDVQTGKQIGAFRGVTEKVRCLALSADGQMVAVGHFGDGKVPPGAVRLWDVDKAKEIRQYPGYTREVSSISFSPDGKRLLTSSFDRAVRVWDVASGKELKKLIGHTSRVECAAFVDGGRRVLFGGNENDPTLQLWDVEQAKQLRRSAPVAGGFLGVAALPGEGSAVTACRDGTIRYWRAGKQ